MIIGVCESNGGQIAKRVKRVIWKYREYFKPPEKKRRVAVGISYDGGIPQIEEVLPGERTMVEATISLHDLLPKLPEEIRAEIFPPAESS